MTDILTDAVSRRQFMQQSAGIGGAFVLGLYLPARAQAQTAPARYAPNVWVQITADDRITILCARSEMGQGVLTGMPTLVAEELEVDIYKVSVQFAPVGPAEYGNALLGGSMDTDGSTSTPDAWTKLRQAGAAARIMLVRAAAGMWGVAESDCTAAHGVIHCTDGRQASYGQVAALAMQQPVPQAAEIQLKQPGQYRYIGKAMHRLDTPSKVTGKARFSIDVHLPNMLHAAVAMSPVLKGTVRSYDASAARGMPGVRQVVQVSSGVAVVADTWWQAKAARDRLVVQWNAGANAGLNDARIHAGLVAAARQAGNVCRDDGDFEQAWTLARFQLKSVYQTPLQPHVSLEPPNMVADVRADGADLYGGTQSQTAAQKVVAQVTGLDPSQIRVHTTFMGGAFGRKSETDYVQQAVEISKAVGRPVKVLWSREDDIQHDFYRPPSHNTAYAALDDNRNLTGLKFSLVSASPMKRLNPGALQNGIDPISVDYVKDCPYDVPNLRGAWLDHEIGVDVGFVRSIDRYANVFTVECFLDEVAHFMGKDPYQLRLSLLGSQPRLSNVLKLAAGAARWGHAASGHHQGIACLSGYHGTYMAMVIDASVSSGQITVNSVLCAVDCGQAINPNLVRQQVEGGVIDGLSSSLYGRINISGGKVQQSNFSDYTVMRMNAAPKITTLIVSSTESPGGLGEPATALAPAALANALFAATGRRYRTMPFQS